MRKSQTIKKGKLSNEEIHDAILYDDIGIFEYIADMKRYFLQEEAKKNKIYDMDEVESIIHDAFLHTQDKVKSGVIPSEKSCIAYFYSTCIFKIKDKCRKIQKMPFTHNDIELLEHLKDEEEDVLKKAFPDADIYEILKKGISDLEPNLQKIIHYKYTEKLSYEEIWKMPEFSGYKDVGSLRNLMLRATKQLRIFLTNRGVAIALFFLFFFNK